MLDSLWFLLKGLAVFALAVGLLILFNAYCFGVLSLGALAAISCATVAAVYLFKKLEDKIGSQRLFALSTPVALGAAYLLYQAPIIPTITSLLSTYPAMTMVSLGIFYGAAFVALTIGVSTAAMTYGSQFVDWLQGDKNNQHLFTNSQAAKPSPTDRRTAPASVRRRYLERTRDTSAPPRPPRFNTDEMQPPGDTDSNDDAAMHRPATPVSDNDANDYSDDEEVRMSPRR